MGPGERISVGRGIGRSGGRENYNQDVMPVKNKN